MKNFPTYEDWKKEQGITGDVYANVYTDAKENFEKRMTPEKLEQLWQDYATREGEEKRETLNEFFANYGQTIDLDEFLCNAVEGKNGYSVRNGSLEDYCYYIYIQATRSFTFQNGESYLVELGDLDIKWSTTSEILADFINEMESIEL